MELMEAIYARRSVRAYKPDPIDRAIIEQLMDTAVQAPTAMNTQPWSFAVIQDQATLKDLSDRVKAYLLSMMERMPFLAGYREVLENPDFSVFYGAPALVIICSRPQVSPTAEIDCALAAENLMLAARGLGMGSCWIGFAHMYLSQPEARQQFGIPADYTVHAPVIIGVPATDWPERERSAPDVLFWK